MALSLIQAGSTAEAPPLEGVGALLTFVAFLVVIIGVPLLLKAPVAEASPATPDGTGPEGDEPKRPRSFFTSRAEKRLWAWSLVVMGLIYTTLTPAQQLAAVLRDNNLLGAVTGAALLGVAVVLGVLWLGTRPGRAEVAVGLGVAAVYVTTIVRLPVPEARSHLFEYGLLALLVYQALRERQRFARGVRFPALTAVVIAAALGWGDEGIQALLPTRVYDLADVAFNAIAATMAVTASAAIEWARRWAKKRA